MNNNTRHCFYGIHCNQKERCKFRHPRCRYGMACLGYDDNRCLYEHLQSCWYGTKCTRKKRCPFFHPFIHTWYAINTTSDDQLERLRDDAYVCPKDIHANRDGDCKEQNIECSDDEDDFSVVYASSTDTINSGINFFDYDMCTCECEHDIFYRPARTISTYNGSLKLTHDPIYILDDDRCCLCNQAGVFWVDLGCGCTFHKDCLRPYLQDQVEQCPSCEPDRCVACVDCRY
jgi:hypothetical protein